MKKLIDEQEALVKDLERESAAAYWDAALNATPENEKRAADLGTQHSLCYADPTRYAALLATDDATDHDTLRARKLLIDGFAGNQMPADVLRDLNERAMVIESTFSSFRANLGGKEVTDNDLKALLKSSTDNAERQQAWEASKLIGEQVAPKLLELVAIRNREAQRLGFPDYYVMQIRLQELDETELFRVLDDTSEQITPAFLEYKASLDTSLAAKYGIAEADLRPWHYADPFFQDAPSTGLSLDSYFEGKDLEAIAKRFFTAIGMPIDRLIAQSDLYERPGKTQHAFCTTIGRGTGDVRVACNLRPDARWMGTLLHEFGHAVYDDLIDRELPYFLRSIAHILTTEAIAEFMGRLTDNPAWLAEYVGVPESDAEAIGRAAHESGRAHLLVFTQWVQVMTHFERALYANPAQDLNTLWWDLVEKYQRVKRPENRSAADWAAKIHLATAPVYYHNYLLGEMNASQFLHTLRKEVAPTDRELVTSPAVGAWLTEQIFRPGARYRWNELLERATGEPLNPAYFVAETVA
ncbi:MAG TPA: M2 family metallopeptidase [Capsulimonadaceae bacterium]